MCTHVYGLKAGLIVAFKTLKVQVDSVLKPARYITTSAGIQENAAVLRHVKKIYKNMKQCQPTYLCILFLEKSSNFISKIHIL